MSIGGRAPAPPETIPCPSCDKPAPFVASAGGTSKTVHCPVCGPGRVIDIDTWDDDVSFLPAAAPHTPTREGTVASESARPAGLSPAVLGTAGAAAAAVFVALVGWLAFGKSPSVTDVASVPPRSDAPVVEPAPAVEPAAPPVAVAQLAEQPAAAEPPPIEAPPAAAPSVATSVSALSVEPAAPPQGAASLYLSAPAAEPVEPAPAAQAPGAPLAKAPAAEPVKEKPASPARVDRTEEAKESRSTAQGSSATAALEGGPAKPGEVASARQPSPGRVDRAEEAKATAALEGVRAKAAEIEPREQSAKKGPQVSAAPPQQLAAITKDPAPAAPAAPALPDVPAAAAAGSGASIDAELPKGATAPKPLAGNPAPRYPKIAHRAGRSGDVVLRIFVSAEGLVTDVTVVEGSEPFVGAAVKAVKKWRYEPAQLQGKAIGVHRTVRLGFAVGSS